MNKHRIVLPILGDPPERVRTPYELVESFYNGQEYGPVGPFFLPAVQHQLVYGLRAVHGRRQPIALFDGLDHVLVTPVPVRAFAVRHDLPHHDTERPDVRRGGELSERYGLGCGPPDRDLTALEIRKLSINTTTIRLIVV